MLDFTDIGHAPIKAEGLIMLKDSSIPQANVDINVFNIFFLCATTYKLYVVISTSIRNRKQFYFWHSEFFLSTHICLVYI